MHHTCTCIARHRKKKGPWSNIIRHHCQPISSLCVTFYMHKQNSGYTACPFHRHMHVSHQLPVTFTSMTSTCGACCRSCCMFVSSTDSSSTNISAQKKPTVWCYVINVVMCLPHEGCVHKLDPVDTGHEPAVRKLPEISLPVLGSVFTNDWLSTRVINWTILLACRLVWLEWQLPVYTVVRNANKSFFTNYFPVAMYLFIMFVYI